MTIELYCPHWAHNGLAEGEDTGIPPMKVEYDHIPRVGDHLLIDDLKPGYKGGPYEGAIVDSGWYKVKSVSHMYIRHNFVEPMVELERASNPNSASTIRDSEEPADYQWHD